MLDKVISASYIQNMLIEATNERGGSMMRNPVWKLTYKGRGIYWHGGRNYGDETGIYAHSIRECKGLIDKLLQAESDNRPEHIK